ncbi:hypothetical protein [Dactylosporangium matsuzakiense]|uniref:Uncharacterized protein n=1 Tax=Dactylosporangium matsuzakiense TaxID=53360 RepID=A0A9W6KIU3_9ACTN|nr:hypothetical protein [Dactylosporangium matsuzakiense]GLL02851.1 hypothetical protein GCM10017581_045930 [Dactylosporangium matsuzakiense]
MEPLLPGPIRAVPTLCCGDNDWWKCVSDSRNLELVLRHSGLRVELLGVFGEILPVYTALLKAPAGQYRIVDRIVVLRDADPQRAKPALSGCAQLQLNVEMPLDLSCGFSRHRMRRGTAATQ